MKKLSRFCLLFCLFFLFCPVSSGLSQEPNKGFSQYLSITGTATTVYQWLNKKEGDISAKDKGSAVIDFNISFKPKESDEFSLRASFAKGDGLKMINPFVLSPNADDLFHDLKDINGTQRDYLQELWYSHTFKIRKDISLNIKAGLIDATAFIDDNAYGADELRQFLNEALVHNPLANLPSYDLGAAVEFEWDKFHLRVVGMNLKNENEIMPVKRYNYMGLQIGCRIQTEMGEGNYRVYAYRTNKRFENWDGDEYKALKGIGLSFDQQLIKDVLGAFFRAGWQDDSAKIDYNRMVSFGLNLNGGVWGRKDDEAGVGYAYLKAPLKNKELKYSQVFEGYVKFKLISYKFLSTDLTLDYQYLRDRARTSEDSKAGHIYGVRFNINF